MTWYEVKTWVTHCDVCHASSEPVASRYRPGDRPEGWRKRVLTDCGLTGYTRTDWVCPACAERLGIEDE